MYCKNCGNKLQPGDKFCNQCGEKTSREENSFSPMFKQEATGATQAMTSNDLENKPRKRNFQIEDFNWDLDGYPSEKNKKTEEIDFNWESVLDEKAKRRQEERVPLFREAPIEERRTPTETTASLEKEIFGENESESDVKKTVRIDKFYTFNKKNEEFQALLDQEYERLKNGTDEEKEEAEPELITTEEILAGQVEESSLEAEPVSIEETAEDELDEFVETEENEELTYVGVALAETPEGVIAFESEEQPIEENPTEEKEIETSGDAEEVAEEDCPPSEETKADGKEEKEEQHKLTFDDIFSDDDDDSEKPAKKHTALKVIAIILCVLIVLEVAVIALTHFAPNSGATQWIIETFNSIKSLFTGEVVPKG